MDDEHTRPLRPASSSLPDARELAPGDHVGTWIIGSRLGGGGFGTVYEARHTKNGTRAALKVLHAHFVASGEMLARFDREIQVLARLRHPNIVQIVDAGFDRDGRPYLCMELLVGRDLSTLIGARALSVAEARRVFEPLCEAIAFAHELGIIHRDLKASNVFVCEPLSRVVLLDFGIAKLSDALAPELTASHQSLGTPGCMAPEQIHGARADARTDIYSLGSLLFHMVTGQQPFHDPSETMTQYLHLHARRPRASAVAPDAPRVDDVIVRAMAIEPSERFQDVRSLLTALRTAMRESRHPDVVSTIDHFAILVSVDDTTAGAELDEALIADLESVIPSVERSLGDTGFALALDLGSTALFIAPCKEVESAGEITVAVWNELEQRAGRDPRVRVGMCLHRGPATVAGNRAQPGPLLRPETWGLPDALEGLWVTSAIEHAARRLR